MVSAFAPGRVELIGNHTDYNEGYVMAFAANMGVTIQGEARSDETVKLRSKEFGEDAFAISSLNKNVHTPWADYTKGVLIELQKAGAPLSGFEAEITSTLPAGSGMSSSAAIEVATALLVQKLFNFQFGDMEDPVTRMTLAAICRNAENEFVGVKCGILDQATSLMGKKDHAVFLDCREQSVEAIPLHPDLCFVICDTGVKHMLLSSKYNARRTECEEAVRVLQMNKIEVKALRDISSQKIQEYSGLFMDRVFRRAMHVTSENERVLAAREALLRNEIETLGRLMCESHESSREAFENSTQYLDMLVEIARSLPACIGARLTGGGFGGATLSMVYRHDAETFMAELTRQYREKSGKEPLAWIVEASDGAA
ncbi:MAG: galactokinase [Verrucomicrobia bacterium]|nr:galactokinase [Verrucomicrobiota bacterium]